MKRFFTLVIFILCQWQFSIAQYDGDQLFDESYIHDIQITTSLSQGELFELYLDGSLNGDYTYTVSDVVIDGYSLDSVGLRIKGGLSAFDEKKPYKLDFNKFVSGQKYDGLKKINLHQGNNDPTFIRESLAYGLLRNAGLKTVRTSFAKVTINGKYEGIYTLVEQIDDDFIKNHFASSEGALYKTLSERLELKYEIDTSLSYSEFETAIKAIPNDLLHEQLHEYLDVESFIRFIIMEIFLNNVDGPLTVDNNYYIYYEPKSGTYTYIPWDYNLSLYGGKNHTIFQSSANFIFEKLKQNQVLRGQYLNTFCQLFQYNFVEDRIIILIDSYQTLLKDEVNNDPYYDEFSDFDAAITSLRNVIISRVQFLTEEMNTSFSPCDSSTNPIQYLDIAINELVTSNNTESGITDPAGGAADWIELYNNSSENISLRNFYLSNDIDFLKHWRFPDDAEILANDYIIIWADRDIDEEGLHTDFKLNKNRGGLYISFENGEIIDSVSYTEQITNIALARTPNGTGSFKMQDATFNASNDFIISTENLAKETDYSIFPNPTNGNTTLKIRSLHHHSSSVHLINMQGKVTWNTKIYLEQGLNLVSIPTKQFSPGMYSLILNNDRTNEKQIQKLVILE